MNNDEKKYIIFKQYWIEKLNTDDNSDKDFIFIQCQMIVYEKWNQCYIIVNVWICFTAYGQIAQKLDHCKLFDFTILILHTVCNSSFISLEYL